MPVLPEWDLGVVPETAKPPYEHHRETSLKHLDCKTVFLLPMALAGRRNKYDALVFDSKYLQFTPWGSDVTLCISPEFMCKTRRPPITVPDSPH